MASPRSGISSRQFQGDGLPFKADTMGSRGAWKSQGRARAQVPLQIFSQHPRTHLGNSLHTPGEQKGPRRGQPPLQHGHP